MQLRTATSRLLLAAVAVSTLSINGALAACEDLGKTACLEDATCFFTTPSKSNNYRSFCTTIPSTCAMAASVKNGGSLPSGVRIGDMCKVITAEDCVFQSAIRRDRRVIRPAACLKEPDFPVACSGAADYASLMPSSLRETCDGIPDCLFRVIRRRKGRVVQAACEDAPAPPATCADAKEWGQTYGQTFADACATTVEDCEFNAAVRRRRNGMMRIVRPARCDPAPTSAPTGAPTTPPPTPAPCNPTARCDGKYVCVKLNQAGNNACASEVSECGGEGILYQNFFCAGR